MSPCSMSSTHPAAGAWLLKSALVIASAAAMTLTARAGPEIALRLPADRVYDGQDSPAAVVFSHESHALFADNNCLACHPEPFSILGNHQTISHETLNEGGYCGICHNGEDATSVSDVESCENCHTGTRPVGAAPNKGPSAVRLARSADSPAQVIFRHETHSQGCAACHPRPFTMKAGATVLDKSKMFEGATCGSCHNGTTAFGVDDDERCETCHVGEEDGR